mmetsp:Transcript_41597/g.120455  ORF Transcript_41597/g.120455 Transcript_41597/m.120455 type:complete len:210 (+) Transcript_41597:365-994(+)
MEAEELRAHAFCPALDVAARAAQAGAPFRHAARVLQPPGARHRCRSLARRRALQHHAAGRPMGEPRAQDQGACCAGLRRLAGRLEPASGRSRSRERASGSHHDALVVLVGGVGKHVAALRGVSREAALAAGVALAAPAAVARGALRALAPAVLAAVEHGRSPARRLDDGVLVGVEPLSAVSVAEEGKLRHAPGALHGAGVVDTPILRSR